MSNGKADLGTHDIQVGEQLVEWGSPENQYGVV